MSTLQTLDRGLTALELIAQTSGGLRVADLAERLGVHRAIAYRIVATLEAHHWVARGPQGNYHLGSAAPVMATRFLPQLLAAAQPALRQLAERTEASAFLSVREGDTCVAVLVVAPAHSDVYASYRLGSRHELLDSAAGIAILAMLSAGPDDSSAVIEAREKGYAMTLNEPEEGTITIAQGLSEIGKVETAIGVIGLPGVDIDNAVSAISHAVKQTTQTLI